MSCCLYWVILEERLSVRVLASAVDDWLLCRVGGFVSYLLVHKGGWTHLSVVPLLSDLITCTVQIQ